MSRTKQSDLLKRAALTPQEIEMIIACLLGDGTLSKSGKNYRLRIEHNSKHKEYVEWKYDLLKRLCVSAIQSVAPHSSVRFGTVGHPEITKLRERWYLQTKQIVGDLKLSPLMIAVWFMDDGTRHRDTVDISVHSFSSASIESLRKQLLGYGIETTINSDSKGSRLYVLKKSYPNFKRLVTPYIVSCMAYKLP